VKKKNQAWVIPTLAVFVYSLVFGSTASAITIKEERELSKEFLRVVASRYYIIDDPVITDYVNKIGRKILAAFPTQLFPYHFYVIKEDSLNAFASPAGHIFINSGLFETLESEEELACIIGHEIAHVFCRHISQRIGRATKMNLAVLAGMMAGILLGSGGSAAAGNAVAVGSMAAGQSLSLSYSREDERQADEIGLQYLTKAGYSGKGLLSSLQKIRSKQWLGSDLPNYLLTHPASEERMAYIEGWLTRYRKKKRDKSENSVDSKEFKRVHTRIVAKYVEASIARTRFKNMLSRNFKDPMAHYGYGMLFSRLGNHTKAVKHLKKALEQSALDPYYLMELGGIYFSEGRYENAVAILTSATGIINDINGKFYLGRAQMELGKLNEAIEKFEEVIMEKSNFNQVYYYLGEAYGKIDNLEEAHYNLGIYYYNKQDLKNTRFHLSRAVKILKNPEKRKEAKQMLAELPRHINNQKEEINKRRTAP
jgi:predicted Zn-dependent protease